MSNDSECQCLPAASRPGRLIYSTYRSIGIAVGRIDNPEGEWAHVLR
jgi:hypothetical protein